MFEHLQQFPSDPILGLIEQAKADTNPGKIDLGVGVYKDDEGRIPVMRAVKAAEKQYWEKEDTKTYMGTAGNQDFIRLMTGIVFGQRSAVVKDGRVAAAQAPGGSGALRLGAEVIKQAVSQPTIWISTPTWANHIPLFETAGFGVRRYPYYNAETGGIEFEQMMEGLRREARGGDVLLLHGCCHNPTGADLSKEQWDQLAEFLSISGIVPFVDIAYQGLGSTLPEDAYGLRKLAEMVPEMLVASSNSKNFALYRERVGMLAIVGRNAESAKINQSIINKMARRLYSVPPNHGAALVVEILSDKNLKKMWQDELTEMRKRIKDLRLGLSKALNVQGAEALAEAIATQKGMFSLLPITPDQAATLRGEHSVYLTDNGRINIAGCRAGQIDDLAERILAVL